MVQEEIFMGLGEIKPMNTQGQGTHVQIKFKRGKPAQFNRSKWSETTILHHAGVTFGGGGDLI